MTSTPPRPVLLGITTDSPIRVRSLPLGSRHALDWTCDPGTFDHVVEMVNTYGGPDAWLIEEIDGETQIIDGTGRTWDWSEQWGGWRSEGRVTHGIETIRSQWGVWS